MYSISASVTLLIGLLITAAFIANKSRWHEQPISQLCIIAYSVVFILSGITHLWFVDIDSNGYYHIIKPQEQLRTSLLALLGLVCLLIGLNARTPRLVGADHALATTNKDGLQKQFIVLGTLLIIPSAWAWYIVLTQLEFRPGHRVISVEDGYGRYVLMLSWMSIGIALLITGFKNYLTGKNGVLLFVLTLCTVIMFYLFSHFGGRVNLILQILPIWLIALPFFRFELNRDYLAIVFFLIIATGWAFFELTNSRYYFYTGSGISFGTFLLDVLDMSAGRFSMLAFADHYAITYGHTGGSLALTDFLQFLQSLGINNDLTRESTFDYLSSEYLVGETRNLYVSAGSAAQILIDFGIFGFMVYWLLYGISIQFLQQAYQNYPNSYIKIVALYTLIYLIFTFHLVTLGAIFPKMIVLAPIIILGIFFEFTRRYRVPQKSPPACPS